MISNQIGKREIFLLLVLTFLLKLSLCIYFSYLGDCKNPELSAGFLAKVTGDTFSYLDPIDNYLIEGEYYFWNGERKVFAGRMPYYGIPYFLFRLFFNRESSADLLVLLQILFDVIAGFYFAKLCYKVLKYPSAFWIGYLIYFLNFNYFSTLITLYTESLSISFTILFLYNFHLYWTKRTKLQVFIACVFLSIAVLLKPYLMPLILVAFLSYLYRERLFSLHYLKEIAVTTILACVPLGLMLSPWILRNAITLQKLIVLQESTYAGYNLTETDLAFRRFVGAWGGDDTFWDAKSPSCYFKLNPPFKCEFTLPPVSLANGYSVLDIENVRVNYLRFQETRSPELGRTVTDEFNRLTNIYRNERPFMFYIGSGFYRINTILWHTNNQNLPIHNSSPCYQPSQLLFKTIQFAIYILSLLLGLPFIFWLLYKNRLSFVFLSIPVYLLLFFGTYERRAEARFFYHAYPVMLLGLVTAFFLIYRKLKKSSEIV